MLRERNLLLVLDNFEHLASAVQLLIQGLTRLPVTFIPSAA